MVSNTNKCIAETHRTQFQKTDRHWLSTVIAVLTVMGRRISNTFNSASNGLAN